MVKSTAREILMVCRRNWSFFVVVIFGFCPLLWFKEDLLIGGGDYHFFLDPSSYLPKYLHTWSNLTNFGFPVLNISFLFPMITFWSFLKGLGLTLLLIEKLWFITVFATTGLSMYFLVRFLQNPEDPSRPASFIQHLARLAAVAAYLFNPYAMNDALSPTMRPMAALLPLLVLLWMKGLRQTKGCGRTALLIGLISIFLSTSNGHPAASTPIIIACLTYLLIFVLATRRFFQALKFLLLSSIFLLLFNLWWFLQFLLSSLSSYSSLSGSIKTNLFIGASHIYETFRFMGNWAFRSIGDIPYAHLYYEPIFLVLTFIVPIIALSALYFAPRDKNVISFALLGLIGVFLSKGTNPPFGGIFGFFFDHVPGFVLYREPYARFTEIQVFAFSTLFGLAIPKFSARLSALSNLRSYGPVKVFRKFWPLAVIFSILITAFPLFTGQIVQDESWGRKSYESLRVKVPEYWMELKEWLKEDDPQARILLLPKLTYVNYYSWPFGGSSGSPIATLFLNNPVVTNPEFDIETYFGDSLIRKFYQLYKPNADYLLTPLFNIFNTDYVLIHNDIVVSSLPANSRFTPEEMKTALVKQGDFRLKKSFGQLDLYEYSKRKMWPSVYVPQEYKYINTTSENFAERFLFSDNPSEGDAYLYSDQLKLPGRVVLGKAETVSIDFELEEKKEGYQKLSVGIPSPGKYTIYLTKSSITGYPINNLSFNLDGEALPINSTDDPIKGYLDLADVHLEAGDHTLEVNYPIPENFFSSEGFFGGRQVAATGEESPESLKDSQIWQLPDRSASSVSFILFKTISPDRRYKVTFWYKNISGKLSSENFAGASKPFGIQQNNCSMPVTKSEFDGRNLLKEGCFSYFFNPDLVESNEWRYFESTFKSEPAARTALMYFMFGEPGAEILIGSPKLEQLLDLNLVAKRDVISPASTDPPVKIATKQLNPAKYLVDVANGAESYEIVLNQSFNSNWKVYIVNSDKNKIGGPLETFFLKSLPESQHFLVNGFANAWEIRTDNTKKVGGDYKLIVEFLPERYYVLGLMVLFVSLTGSFVYFTRIYIIRNRKLILER